MHTYPHKATEFGMLKELRDNLGFKDGGLLHDKGRAVFGPSGHGRIARVHHVVGFFISQVSASASASASRLSKRRRESVSLFVCELNCNGGILVYKQGYQGDIFSP